MESSYTLKGHEEIMLEIQFIPITFEKQKTGSIQIQTEHEHLEFKYSFEMIRGSAYLTPKTIEFEALYYG